MKDCVLIILKTVISVVVLLTNGDPALASNSNRLQSKQLSTEPTKIINPYNYSFILQPSPCTSEDELLIIIHSSTKSTYNNRRMLMRSTWLKKDLLSQKIQLKVKIAFIVGSSQNSTLQQRMQYESEMYNDIIQVDFEDTYINNAYKAMAYLLWTSLHCTKAKLLMKIDDDTLLKISTKDGITKTISELIKTGKPVYAGKGINSVPNRNKKSKWYVSKEVWAPDLFPLWFQGLAYFLTPRHAGRLFNAALETHYMHTDDVFVGILVNKTKSIGPFAKTLRYLSEFTEGDINRNLRSKWLQGRSKFFHVPDLKLYYSWAMEDLEIYNNNKHRKASKSKF